MQVDEIRARRRELEAELSRKVGEAVIRFREETGFSPDSISVEMLDVTSVGDKEPRYEVSRCVVDVKI